MDHEITYEPLAASTSNLARSLIAYEVRKGFLPERSPGAVSRSGLPERSREGAERVWQKLTPYLEGIFGGIAFQALFSRALMLAKAEHGWLDGAAIENGSGRLHWSPPTCDNTELMDGAVSLLAHFLSILESLIGLDLTARMIQRIWTEV